MNRGKIKDQMDKIILIAGLAVTVIFALFVYQSEMRQQEKIVCFGVSVCLGFFSIALWHTLRRQVLEFSDFVCRCIDTLINGEIPQISEEEDTLSSKIQMKLDKLSDITHSLVTRQTNQKQEIQQMVSDISHQLKTPIANLTMYSSMLENENLDGSRRKQFLNAISSQVEKMEFLVEALAKMSRLESHLISLKIQPARILDTLLHGVMQISSAAEKKRITIEIDCDEQLMLPHDAKWTAEALFNIMDNAVKYTPEGGKISITAEPWELFTKIEIEDTGIGISKEHYQDIFKRFYREGKVHLIEGVGIGLYLSREVITQQGGYIKVKSEEKKGTAFSVFLPNQMETS